jgi:segregation and condensation protein B
MPDEPSAIELAQAAAARLGGGDWQLDAEPEPVAEPESAPEPTAAPPPRPAPPPDDTPPPVTAIIEAMLFAGGPPLTAAQAVKGVRGLTPETFRESVDSLAKKYRDQRRPYAVRPRGDGFALAARPEFRAVKDRLHGGPREARLGQPALDVLSLVAYRQPIAKADLDALRGADAGPPLRQLVRLGLVAAGRGGGGYATTPRFLDLFGLSSLDDLPRLADAAGA